MYVGVQKALTLEELYYGFYKKIKNKKYQYKIFDERNFSLYLTHQIISIRLGHDVLRFFRRAVFFDRSHIIIYKL